MNIQHEIRKPINNINELIDFCSDVNVAMTFYNSRILSTSLKIGYDGDDSPVDVWLCSEYDDDINVIIQQKFPLDGQVIIDKVLSELDKDKESIDGVIENVKKLLQ